MRLWDVAQRSAITTFRGHTGMVKSLSFSPDGKTLASAGVDSTVRLWDTVSKQGLTTLRGPSVTLAVAFSPDGKRLATGASDGTVRVWDPATREVVAMLRGHSAGIVRALAYAPDGQTLVSAGEDGTVKVWDVAARREPEHLDGRQGLVHNPSPSPPTARPWPPATGRGTLRLWDVASREHVAALPGDKGPGCCVTFAPDGRTLAAGSGKTVRLWDTRPEGAAGGVPTPRQLPVDCVLSGRQACGRWRSVYRRGVGSCHRARGGAAPGKMGRVQPRWHAAGRRPGQHRPAPRRRHLA